MLKRSEPHHVKIRSGRSGSPSHLDRPVWNYSTSEARRRPVPAHQHPIGPRVMVGVGLCIIGIPGLVWQIFDEEKLLKKDWPGYSNTREGALASRAVYLVISAKPPGFPEK